MIAIELQRASSERLAEEAMLPICCDAIEQAIAAGVLVAGRSAGAVYVHAGGRYWAIQHCPHCGMALTLPESTVKLEVVVLSGGEPLPIRKRTRRSCRRSQP